MKKINSNKSGGTLTLTKLEQVYKDAMVIEEEKPMIIVSPQQLAFLKKKYPKKFSKWERFQYKCSFQRLLDK